MKNILLPMALFLIISCDEETPPETKVHPIVGTWDATSISLEATFLTTEEVCNGEVYSWVNDKCMAVIDSENQDWEDMAWTFNPDNTLTILVVSEENETTTGTWSINGDQLTTITYDPEDADGAESESNTGTYSITNNVLVIISTMDIEGLSYPATFVLNRR